MYLPTTNTLAWATNSTERLRLDASGNLGLGVTPSSWGSTFKAVELGTIGNFLTGYIGAARTELGTNAYYNGSAWTYANTAAATRFTQISGEHRWYNAPSGTAGNAISFTQAMTLDASGNLLVGVTTQYGGLKVQIPNNQGYGVQNAAGNGLAAWFGASASAGFASAGDYALLSGSSGLLFATGTTERARIDASGNLLVGTTSGTNPGGIIQAKSTAANMQCFGAWNAVDSGQAYLFYGGTGSTWTARYQIYWNFTGGTGTAGFLSDYRQKDNVRKLTGGLDAVNALKPSIYRFKDAIQDASGFIAHEVQEVIPQAVSGHKDEVDEDGEPKYQMLDQTHIIPYLTAAIQELTARLEALEGAK